MTPTTPKTEAAIADAVVLTHGAAPLRSPKTQGPYSRNGDNHNGMLMPASDRDRSGKDKAPQDKSVWILWISLEIFLYFSGT